MDFATFQSVAHAGKDTDPGWYRMHRRLSIHVTRAAVRTGATADDASYAMIAAGLAGSFLIAFTSPVLNVLGFALLYAGFLLDKVDGELARVLHVESARGVFLDRLYHRLVEPLVFVAVAVHEFQLTGVPGALIAGFVTALAANAIEENQQLAPFILWKRLREGGRMPQGARAPSRSRTLARLCATLRPLKGFRMLIVVLPLFAVAYVAERLWGGAFPAIVLYLAALSLVVYLVVQSLNYLGGQMDGEIFAIAQVLRGLDLGRPQPSETRLDLREVPSLARPHRLEPPAAARAVRPESTAPRPAPRPALHEAPAPRPLVKPAAEPRRRKRRHRKPRQARMVIAPQGEIACAPLPSGPNR